MDDKTVWKTLVVRANGLVDRATTARLDGDDVTANELLRDAAELYHEAGEDGEAQACRMLITSPEPSLSE